MSPMPDPAAEAGRLAEAETEWIDPIAEDQELTTFRTYPQGSRDGADGQPEGSYQLYLPPQYAEASDQRFPVIYWLHGGFGDSRQGAHAIERIDQAIRDGAMPPSIVVVPQALPIGWYVDSKDGARPVEQTIAVDLVNHVDQTHRTVPRPGGRSIEGFSMGGYGALRLAFKYPNLFSSVSAIAPAVLRDMSMEPEVRVANTFFGDHAYYAAVSPWTLLLGNSPRIRGHLKVRIMCGTKDTRLLDAVGLLADDLNALGVRHRVHIVEGADHDYAEIIDALGEEYGAFWNASAAELPDAGRCI